MATLELPPVSARTLKMREIEIGVTIEKVAKNLVWMQLNCSRIYGV